MNDITHFFTKEDDEKIEEIVKELCAATQGVYTPAVKIVSIGAFLLEVVQFMPKEIRKNFTENLLGTINDALKPFMSELDKDEEK